nr:immunoglobulin light chain junction region [Macaca mulatta]MOX07168.1 immunoglobulin light chain junction region [Macaca mulatta]MOX07322.1 immunoglobulin light chain junction region [Macaca mulatta]MOX07381.1 immunoglobulin light chain junction region [Macaca mulatta]MOX07740.1 immunoglobulin light chain junction region [Macaca mulatta]
CMQALEVPFTF